MARQELRFGHARAHSRSELSCAVWRTAGTYQLFFLNDSKQLIAGSTGYNSGFIITLKLQCPPANIFHLTSPMPFSLLPPNQTRLPQRCHSINVTKYFSQFTFFVTSRHLVGNETHTNNETKIHHINLIHHHQLLRQGTRFWKRKVEAESRQTFISCWICDYLMY